MTPSICFLRFPPLSRLIWRSMSKLPNLYRNFTQQMPAHGSWLKLLAKCYSYKRFYILFHRFCFICSRARVPALKRQHDKIGEGGNSTQISDLFNYASELIEGEYEYMYSDSKRSVSKVFPTDTGANGNRKGF